MDSSQHLLVFSGGTSKEVDPTWFVVSSIIDFMQEQRKGLIVGAGFQKTGTTSLREALKVLGYRVKDTDAKALMPILRGNYRKILQMLEDYDAVEDTPWYMIYKELDHHIPNSKFILTIRDAESWYKSVTRHFGDLKYAVHEYVYGRGKGLPKDDKDHAIAVYNQHNAAVVDYFKDRPDDLLILDFTKGDQWEKLCAFLGKEIPDVPFPHSNSFQTRELKKKSKFKLLRKRVKNNFKIKYIDLLGLWPDRK